MAKKNLFVTAYGEEPTVGNELYVLADTKTEALDALAQGYDEGSVIYEVQVVNVFRLKQETKHSLEPVK